MGRFCCRLILSLWVNDDNIGVGVGQNDVRHFFLCRKGFACTRYAEDKGITVEQVAAVSDNHILADYILPVINAVFVIDFLHPKRNKHRKAFRSKGTQGVNLSHTERQHRNSMPWSFEPAILSGSKPKKLPVPQEGSKILPCEKPKRSSTSYIALITTGGV